MKWQKVHFGQVAENRSIMTEIVKKQQQRQRMGEKNIAIPLRSDQDHVLLNDKSKRVNVH